METMRCDKCDRPVDPNNNTKVYDAALAALTSSYDPQVAVLIPACTIPVFQCGEIVDGDPAASIHNVLSTHLTGRHFHADEGCVGSPSRRGNIEGRTWGNGNPLDAAMAEAAARAYRLMMEYQKGG